MNQPSLAKQFIEKRDVILGFLYSLMRDYDAAEEVFQEVSVVILEEANRNTAVSNFLAWMREIARRRVREYYRNNDRLRRFVQLPESLEAIIDQSFAESEQFLEGPQQRMKFLLECLEKLPGRSRQLIDGFYRHRQSLRELATSFGWQADSIKVALSRARKALGNCIHVKMRSLEGDLGMVEDRFAALLERFQACESTDQELVELEVLLRADPARRRRLAAQMFLEVQLYKALAIAKPALPKGSRAASFQSLRWAVAAGLLLALVGLWALSSWGPWSRHGGDPLATLVASGQVRVDDQQLYQIPRNKPFEVMGAMPAQFQLPDGSRMTLDPATQAKVLLLSADQRPVIELTAGGGTFQVAKGSEQFSVRTPIGSVTALGTEFTVRLRPGSRQGDNNSMRMTVAVQSGKVQVDTGGLSFLLSAGNRRQFGDDGEQNNRDDGDQNNQ